MSAKSTTLLSGHAGARAVDRHMMGSLVAFAAFLVLLAVLPLFLPGFLQILMTRFLIFSIYGMAYNIAFGYCGMLSLGHGVFFGVGAYAVGLLSLHGGITSLWVALPVAIVAATATAAVLSLFFLRVSGTYFLLITFGFSMLFWALAWNVKWLSLPGMQGIAGIGTPTLGFADLTWGNLSLYYLVLIFFVLSYWLIKRIIDSPLGCALVGVREGEGRMRVLGYNVWAFRYLALVISGAFCGLAGMLFAYNNSFVHPDNLGFNFSWIPMLIVIIGGAGTKFGPVVGAALVVWLEYVISLYTAERWPLILGAVFVAVVMYFPGGVVVTLGRLLEKAGGHARHSKPSS